MTKRLLICCFMLCLTALGAQAQSAVKYGYLNYDSLLYAMPEYATAQRDLAELRKKYEQEAVYNEKEFKRLFADFLQGQKDFPQNILLKRQRDLQDAMERGLAFRRSADSLLACAERDLLRPVHTILNAAIRAVGLEHGYEYILNTAQRAYPFIHPEVAEDATPFVRAKLTGVVQPVPATGVTKRSTAAPASTTKATKEGKSETNPAKSDSPQTATEPVIEADPVIVVEP